MTDFLHNNIKITKDNEKIIIVINNVEPFVEISSVKKYLIYTNFKLKQITHIDYCFLEDKQLRIFIDGDK